MQFIPSTWHRLGRDGNGNRVADPNNLFDAATSTAGYLCLVGGDLSGRQGLRRAVYGYNHSWAYVDAVLRWASLYEGGVAVGPAGAAGLPGAAAAPPSGPLPRPGQTTADVSSPPGSPGRPPPHARPIHHDHAAADQLVGHHHIHDHPVDNHHDNTFDHDQAVPDHHHLHHHDGPDTTTLPPCTP